MEQLINDGRVQVNGETVAIGARALATDRIQLDGQPIERGDKQRRILLYYKPVGELVSQEEDSRTVFDNLPPLSGCRWMNIGRLDINSEGLLIFSTDGEWVHRMMHPKQAIEREYRVRASGILTDDILQAACRRGVLIGDTRPVVPRLFTAEESGDGLNRWYRIILTEGRNRAVRRLFEHYDLQISRLIRTRYGRYRLPADLSPGEWREIQEADEK